jgi:outer membrane protein OmpA-like peptidoglycan-associated protein
MNRTLLIPLFICLVVALGCVSKNYVRNQVTPVINKTNELDDLTAKNTNEIKDVDRRAQEGIGQALAATSTADQKAQAADQQAQQAQARADDAARRVVSLEKVVVGSDDYQVVSETSVQFDTNRFDLTNAAKAELDQLATNTRDLKGDIIVVEGFTDSTGSAEDNYSLSSRRANTVRQYLAVQYNLAAFRIHTVGLGEDNPVASNKTKEGRAKNRRTKVQLMSNAARKTTTAANQ